MNERIEGLAEQCTTINDSTTIPVDKDFDYKKFAELIVKECIDIAEQTRYDGKVVAERIKFVFGVEE